MPEPEEPGFQIGDRVKMVVSLPMAQVGAQGRITALNHDETDRLRSLTVLLDHESLTTRGITVFPHEIAALEPGD